MSTWIFLRGLTREARHWGNFPAIFHAENPEAEIITLDLPGNGKLHHLTSPMRVEEMTAFCREALRIRGIAPPYCLFALSMGAMVAVDWALRQTEEVQALVLINTSLRPLSPFYQRLQPRNYWDLMRSMLIGGDPEKQERLVLRLTSSRGDSQTDILNDWMAYRQECPVSRCNALRQLLAATRYRLPACKPIPPVLVLASSCDRLVNPQCSRRLADHWETSLAIHPTAGHDLPLDDGAWVARQVRDWLAVVRGKEPVIPAKAGI